MSQSTLRVTDKHGDFWLIYKDGKARREKAENAEALARREAAKKSRGYFNTTFITPMFPIIFVWSLPLLARFNIANPEPHPVLGYTLASYINNCPMTGLFGGFMILSLIQLWSESGLNTFLIEVRP